MYRLVFSKFFLIAALGVAFSFPNFAAAQNYLGDLPTGSNAKDAQEQTLRPATKIFSSKVVSTEQAVKLDYVYDNLAVSLWNYAVTDFRHQKRLMTLMEPKRFKTTRYSKEFTPPMDDALQNLNDNYRQMMRDIEQAEQEYKTVREGIRSVDYEILDPLWREKIDGFKAHANRYFKMQHSFLKSYRSLVAFILKQGGSYYYKEDTQRVHFYRFEGYKFFGQTIDRLNKTNYEMRKHLRVIPPSNVDESVISGNERKTY